MDRRAVVRPLMFGALVTGLVPLTSAGVGGAAADESPAGVCSATFGERGPADGSVAGEGPAGDPMPVTIAWNPADWPAGLRDVITCVSVDGRAVPSLATAQGAPPNTGTFNFNLTLPVAAPGAVVCQQSVLVGAGSAGGQRRPTSAMCFKLRAAHQPPAAPASTIGDTPVALPSTPPARTHAPTPPARPAANARARTGTGAPPARTDADGPPAGTGTGAPAGVAIGAPPRPTAPAAPPVASPATRSEPGGGDDASAPRPAPRRSSPAHLLAGAWGGPWAGGSAGPADRPAHGSRAAASAPAPAPQPAPPVRAAVGAPGSAGRSSARPAAAPASRARAAAPAPAEAAGAMAGPTASGAPDAEAPRAALARTGIADRVPLAAGGSLLALGGAAIVLAEPRRRTRPARTG